MATAETRIQVKVSYDAKLNLKQKALEESRKRGELVSEADLIREAMLEKWGIDLSQGVESWGGHRR